MGALVFMFSLEPSLTGLLLGIIPLFSILTVQYGSYLNKLRKNLADEMAESIVVAEETIGSMRTVRSFGAEEKLNKEYDKKVRECFQIGKHLAVAQGGFTAFVGILTAGTLSLILWYGGKLVNDKKISTGLLASFLTYTLQVVMGKFISTTSITIE